MKLDQNQLAEQLNKKTATINKKQFKDMVKKIIDQGQEIELLKQDFSMASELISELNERLVKLEAKAQPELFDGALEMAKEKPKRTRRKKEDVEQS